MENKDENLIKALGIETLPDEQKARIVDQSSDLIQQRVFVRMIEMLSEDKRAEFNQILESGDQAKLSEFINAEAPHMADWIKEEVESLREELNELGKVE